jgi:hypothetical protein
VFLRNIRSLSTNYTALYPRRQYYFREVLSVFIVLGRSQQNARWIWYSTLNQIRILKTEWLVTGSGLQCVTLPPFHTAAVATVPVLVAILLTSNPEAWPNNSARQYTRQYAAFSFPFQFTYGRLTRLSFLFVSTDHGERAAQSLRSVSFTPFPSHGAKRLRSSVNSDYYSQHDRRQASAQL